MGFGVVDGPRIGTDAMRAHHKAHLSSRSRVSFEQKKGAIAYRLKSIDEQLRSAASGTFGVQGLRMERAELEAEWEYVEKMLGNR